MRPFRIVVTALVFALLGCESIFGLDFDGLHQQQQGYVGFMTGCDPTNPAEGSDELSACPASSTCARDAGNEFFCEPLGAQRGDNETCKEDKDCAPGFGCYHGVCHQWCNLDRPYAICTSCVATEFHALDESLGVCVDSCNLENGGTCPSNVHCSVTEVGALCEGFDGPVGLGGRCTADLDCEHGLGCQMHEGHFGDNTGTCEQWCYTSSNCSEGSCLLGDKIVDGTRYGYCYEACDPLEAQDESTSKSVRACAPGQRCEFAADGKTTFCADLGASPLHEDNPCAHDLDCAAGLTCVGQDSGGACLAYCDRSAESADCGAGRSCTLFASERSLSDQRYGYCASAPCDPRSPLDPAGTFAACKPGQTCTLAGSNISYCKTQASAIPPGAACSLDVSDGEVADPCQAGSSCAHSGFDSKYCRAWCRVGTNDCDGVACEQPLSPISLAGVLYGFCALPLCNPLNPYDDTPPFVACAGGLQCRFGELPSTSCIKPEDNRDFNVECTSVDQCRSDAACVTPAGGGPRRCVRECRLHSDDCGDPDYPNCIPLPGRSATLFGIEYGYCTGAQ